MPSQEETLNTIRNDFVRVKAVASFSAAVGEAQHPRLSHPLLFLYHFKLENGNLLFQIRVNTDFRNWASA
jgi:hypothetical protein